MSIAERPYTAIMVDLDGTISDSAPGILVSLTHTFQRVSVPVPDHATLMSIVVPPILDTFRVPMDMYDALTERTLAVYQLRLVPHTFEDEVGVQDRRGLTRDEDLRLRPTVAHR